MSYIVGYQLIQKQKASGSSGTIIFSNIPQIYTHLKILINARCDDSIDVVSLNIKFNNTEVIQFLRVNLQYLKLFIKLYAHSFFFRHFFALLSKRQSHD